MRNQQSHTWTEEQKHDSWADRRLTLAPFPLLR